MALLFVLFGVIGVALGLLAMLAGGAGVLDLQFAAGTAPGVGPLLAGLILIALGLFVVPHGDAGRPR
ncbi:MAG TPA: hypothetical protein VNK43_12545 [Gemmatimonadales bacterium]|nr:hypothetical protein [Gemmatimonadales bacterium]